MKHILLLLLFAFPGIISSQNWQVVGSNKEVYFSEPSRNMHAIRTDSARLIGGDSVFYHFRTKRVTNNSYPCNGDPYAPSWLGLKTLVSPGRKSLFFNKTGDSISVYPESAPGSSWTLYTYSNGNYLLASVTSAGLGTVLSVTDSIKTLSLQAYGPGATPVANSWNNKQLILSKTHGIIQIYNICNFPQDTTTYRIAEGHRMTYGEVYDFQIGDLFEYNISYSDGPPTTVVRKVIAKTTWTDSVQYTYTDTTYTRTMAGCCTINSFATVSTYTIICRHLSAPIMGNYLPEQSMFLNNRVSMYVMTSSMGNCDPLSINTCDGNYFVNSSSCWGTAFEPVLDCYTFQTGLGDLRSTNYTTIGGNSSDETFNWYKKDTLVCGTWAPTPAGIHETGSLNDLLLSLFPNPAQNTVTLSWSSDPASRTCKIELFNPVSAKAILSVQTDFSSGTAVLNVSDLSAGIYLIRLSAGTYLAQTKFVKD